MSRHRAAKNFHGYGNRHAWTMDGGEPWYEGESHPAALRARRQVLRASKVRTEADRADSHLNYRAGVLVSFVFSDMSLDDWQQRFLINTLRAQGER